jgi:hypothetical protein
MNPTKKRKRSKNKKQKDLEGSEKNGLGKNMCLFILGLTAKPLVFLLLLLINKL